MIKSSPNVSENKLKSICFVFWQALIPGLIIWLLLDPSLNLVFNNLSKLIALKWMFLIAFAMLSFTIIATTICYWLGFHPLEQFIYSVVVMLEFVILYLTSLIFLPVFYRVIIALSVAVLGTLILTMIVMLIKNNMYWKKENEN